jgi:hypothetical protein
MGRVDASAVRTQLAELAQGRIMTQVIDLVVDRDFTDEGPVCEHVRANVAAVLPERRVATP